MNHKENSPMSYVVILGCGRLGAHLAERLGGRGASVVVIDREPRAFALLPAEFSGFTLEGDGAEVAVLRQAKCGHADLFMAVTGSDNLNLMAAQVAGPLLGATRSMARVDDPQRLAAFADLGIEVVSPTSVMAGLFLSAGS